MNEADFAERAFSNSMEAPVAEDVTILTDENLIRRCLRRLY